MTDRELMQMALDALLSATPRYKKDRKDGKAMDGALDYWKLEQHIRMPAIATLRARLAQPEPELVLQDIEQYRLQMAAISTAAIGYWKESDGIHPDYDTLALRDVAKLYEKYDALYTAPPQRKEWQSLTDEEIAETSVECAVRTPSDIHFARVIEAKLREKNA